MAEKVYFVVHFEASTTLIIDIAQNRERAKSKAEQFVFENAPLTCEVIELTAVSRTKYPKE